MISTEPPAMIDGRLPLGRHACTPSAARRAYVPDEDSHRQELWSQWEELTHALIEAAGVVESCWMSGSFFSLKELPRDIDCLYLVDSTRINPCEPSHRRLIRTILEGKVKETFGLDVDAYLIAVERYVGLSVGCPTYLQNRGYWDELWSRRKSVDPRRSLTNRIGYLEVMLDEF